MKRIGITFGLQKSSRYGIHSGYSDALTELSALPVFFSSGSAAAAEAPSSGITLEELASSFLQGVDALIISGGWDVDPELYGEATSAKVVETEPVRDRLESALLNEAARVGKKVFAVCRGIQILNVSRGGTLYQDLEDSGFDNHSDLTREYESAHEISFESNSLIEELTEGATGVNTLHHQAIRDLGAGLRAVAYSPDGVIEAVEGDNVLGVQWHPERLFKSDKRHLGTFAWLLT